MSTKKLQLAVSLDATPELAAKIFCELDDTEQAQFFEVVGRAMKTWESPARIFQLHAVGRALRDNEAFSDDGRKVVREIYEAIEEAKP